MNGFNDGVFRHPYYSIDPNQSANVHLPLGLVTNSMFPEIITALQPLRSSFWVQIEDFYASSNFYYENYNKK